MVCDHLRNPPCQIWASGSAPREEPFIAQVTQTWFFCPLVALNATLLPPIPASLAYRHDFVGLQQNDLMYYEKYTEPIFDRSGRSVEPTQEETEPAVALPIRTRCFTITGFIDITMETSKSRLFFSIFKTTDSSFSF